MSETTPEVAPDAEPVVEEAPVETVQPEDDAPEANVGDEVPEDNA